MTHLWVRAEQRPNEDRVGLMPDGAAELVSAGLDVTIEVSRQRCIPLDAYRAVGCAIAPEGSWPDAPADAVVFGLKELPDDGTPLRHTHILFGHAYKGQPAGQVLLRRFRAGGGNLLDLESLTDDTGRRVAAFGYWAGFAGAAVSLLALVAPRDGGLAGPVDRFSGRDAMVSAVTSALKAARVSDADALVIGALGRVGRGAADLCAAAGVKMSLWDMTETAHGGPFPEVFAHSLLLNCILARPGCPVFVPSDTGTKPRRLRVIGDIACDPTSDFSPIKVYDRATDWARPVLRVHDAPPLDVMAIDNLPSLLPREASEDFAAQLLPHLLALPDPTAPVWTRARAAFAHHVSALPG